MIKKIVIGVVGLGIIGGAAWAGVQYFGPGQDSRAAASPDDEDDDRLILRRRGAGGTTAGEPGGPGDDGGEPMISDGDVVATGAVALPILRSGLWEVTQNDDAGTRTSQVCLDTAIQSEANIFGSQLHAPFCPSGSTVNRQGADRWTYSSRCPLPMNSSVTVSGEIRSDRNRRYSHKLTLLSITPVGRETTTSTEEGRYLGRCPAGVSGGDILVDGSKMMNIRDAMALGQVMVPGAFGGSAPE